MGSKMGTSTSGRASRTRSNNANQALRLTSTGLGTTEPMRVATRWGCIVKAAGEGRRVSGLTSRIPDALPSRRASPPPLPTPLPGRPCFRGCRWRQCQSQAAAQAMRSAFVFSSSGSLFLRGLAGHRCALGLDRTCLVQEEWSGARPGIVKNLCRFDGLLLRVFEGPSSDGHIDPRAEFKQQVSTAKHRFKRRRQALDPPPLLYPLPEGAIGHAQADWTASPFTYCSFSREPDTQHDFVGQFRRVSTTRLLTDSALFGAR